MKLPFLNTAAPRDFPPGTVDAMTGAIQLVQGPTKVSGGGRREGARGGGKRERERERKLASKHKNNPKLTFHCVYKCNAINGSVFQKSVRKHV